MLPAICGGRLSLYSNRLQFAVDIENILGILRDMLPEN